MRHRQASIAILLALMTTSLTCSCTSTDEQWSKPYGAPRDPRPEIKREHSRVHYYTLDDLYNPLNDATEKLRELLEEGDFDAAQAHMAGMCKRFGSHTDAVSFCLMPGLYEKGRYDSVIWLADKSPVAFTGGPTPRDPGACTYYYLAIWRSDGPQAVVQAHERLMRASVKDTATTGLQAEVRLGWLEAQLAVGTLDYEDVKRELAEEIRQSPWGFTWQTGATEILRSLCVVREDYDWLRHVALRSIFEGNEHSTLHVLWQDILLPAWAMDGKGPTHLIEMAEQYLQTSQDAEASARAQFFKATMHHLAAAFSYRSVMLDTAATDTNATKSNLRFALDAPFRNSLSIRTLDRLPTSNTLAQQAAHHLNVLAPGSYIGQFRTRVPGNEPNQPGDEQKPE